MARPAQASSLKAAKLLAGGRAKAAHSSRKAGGQSIEALKAAAIKLGGARGVDAAAFQAKLVHARSAIRSARARD